MYVELCFKKNKIDEIDCSINQSTNQCFGASYPYGFSDCHFHAELHANLNRKIIIITITSQVRNEGRKIQRNYKKNVRIFKN